MKKQWTIRKAVLEDAADLQSIMASAYILLTENISLYQHLGWSEIERNEVRVYLKKEIY